MSVRLMSKIFEYDMPHLHTTKGKRVPDSTAKFVLLALADCANDEGEGAYPSIDTLCKKTNMSTATVCRAIEALIVEGYLYFEGFSKYRTKVYSILAAKIDGASQDFSGYNPRILAAKNKPLVKPLVSKDTTSDDVEDCPDNLEPDHQEQPKILPKVPGTTNWPKDVYPLALAFAELKGRDPYRHEYATWIKEFREAYLPARITVDELKRMYQIVYDKFGSVRGPKSLLFTLDIIRPTGNDKQNLPPDTTSNQSWRDVIFRGQ
jgi:hypothetical protein